MSTRPAVTWPRSSAVARPASPVIVSSVAWTGKYRWPWVVRVNRIGQKWRRHRPEMLYRNEYNKTRIDIAGNETGVHSQQCRYRNPIKGRNAVKRIPRLYCIIDHRASFPLPRHTHFVRSLAGAPPTAQDII